MNIWLLGTIKLHEKVISYIPFDARRVRLQNGLGDFGNEDWLSYPTESFLIVFFILNQSIFFHSGSAITKPSVTSVNGNSALKRKASSSSSSSDSEEEKQSNNVSVNNTIKTNNDEMTVSKDNGKQKRQSSPFRRVREEDADQNYLQKIGKNAFEHKAGARGSWGEKANADLKNTRGKSFRHEKTKKKRGSYHGGKIDSVNSFSIKFDDSDD
ncbi:unnamed protein product [Rotaria sordida]|uniref:Srp40 C-terminal domain-containing protein n=1 Tax=Rotaria sordida TaxID=392033 RepID=A0A818QS14_9BILA|nr:unnamed protein product [Rotaria sordida]